MSINREMDKEGVVHLYNGILATRKDAICSNMDGPTYCILSEVRGRHISYYIVYMGKLKNVVNTNDPIYRT